VLAAGLSLLWLWRVQAPWPGPAQWRLLLVAAAGNALADPLALAWALRTETSQHAAVITALAPLATSAVAAMVLRQRVAGGFWACALAGCALVVAFSLWRAQQAGQGWQPPPADAWLALGVLAASIGYVAGARITPALGAERVICWVTLAALPVTLPGALLDWAARPPLASVPIQRAHPACPSAPGWAWPASVCSRCGWPCSPGTARWRGDAVRTSQVQLLQPFFAMLFAWPIHGQPVTLSCLGVGLAVVATVWLGRRFSAATPTPAGPSAGPPSPAASTR